MYSSSCFYICALSHKRWYSSCTVSKQYHSSDSTVNELPPPSKLHLHTVTMLYFFFWGALFRTDYKWLYKDTYLFHVKDWSTVNWIGTLRHLFLAITLPLENFYAYIRECRNLWALLCNNCLWWTVYLYKCLVLFMSW